jgi:hypothetical protein
MLFVPHQQCLSSRHVLGQVRCCDLCYHLVYPRPARASTTFSGSLPVCMYILTTTEQRYGLWQLNHTLQI